MNDEQKPGKPIKISVSENLNLSEKPEVETAIVTTITPTGIEKTSIYDITTASGYIVRESIAANNIQFMPDQIEIVTETVERSKGLGMGFKLSFDFLNFGKFEFEKKPTKEIKATMKSIYKDPQKK